MARLLIIDEDLNPRIRTELNRRGRNAKGIAELGLRGSKDPDLLERITQLDPNCVLVTGDDDKPATHAEQLATLEITLAVVAPHDPGSGLTEDQWEREIVHQWVRQIEAQPHGSIRRYTLAGPRRWTPRRRPPRI